MAAGLRRTYEKLVKTGMVQETNPDGTPAKMPDMEEVRYFPLLCIIDRAKYSLAVSG